MPVSKRRAIFEQLKADLVTLSSLTDETVVIGVYPANRVGRSPVVLIQPGADRGQVGDCGVTNRTLEVGVGMVLNIDALKNDEDLLQLEDAYQPLHDKMEQIASEGLGGLADVQEGQIGIEAGGFDGVDNIAYIGCTWLIKYERALEAS